MLAVTLYAIPSLILNGGVGITSLYFSLAALNTVLRILKTVDDFYIDVIVLLQTTFFCILGGLVFILIKSRIHRQGINLIQNAQVAAIKSASIANDSSTKSSEKTITTESETNPVQRILRRNSSIVMKYCPYTSDENVVFDCPSCFAKVGVSAWHFGDKCSRMGGGCFFSLRKRMGTLLDLSEDIDAYQEETDVQDLGNIKDRIVNQLSTLQFKKENFDETDTASLKDYVYWQMQRSLMCKANYLFRAVTECCKPCHSNILATEVVNRSFLSYSCMGLLVSFFLLRASPDVRDIRGILFFNGMISPCLAMNAMLSSMMAAYEVYGLGKQYPHLFKDHVISRFCETFKYVFISFGMKQYFTD